MNITHLLNGHQPLNSQSGRLHKEPNMDTPLREDAFLLSEEEKIEKITLHFFLMIGLYLLSSIRQGQ